MKRWWAARKSLAHFGITDLQRKEEGVKVVRIEDDATVVYETKDSAIFSANMYSGKQGIDENVVIPEIPGQIVVDGDINFDYYQIASGASHYEVLQIRDEEGNVFMVDELVMSSTNNSKVRVDKTGNTAIKITGLLLGAIETVTITLLGTDVFTTFTVEVIE